MNYWSFEELISSRTEGRILLKHINKQLSDLKIDIQLV